MEKSKLLDRCGAEGEDRLLLAKVLDRAEQAAGRSIPAHTDFLSPQQLAQAQDLLHLAGIPETAWLRQGGYQEAERNILRCGDARSPDGKICCHKHLKVWQIRIICSKHKLCMFRCE